MDLSRHIKAKGKRPAKKKAAPATPRGYGEAKAVLQPLLAQEMVDLSTLPHTVFPISLRPSLSGFGKRHGLKLLTKTIEGTSDMMVFVLATAE